MERYDYMTIKTLFLLSVSSAVLMLSACSGVEKEAKYPTGSDRIFDQSKIYEDEAGIFGQDGLSVLGGDSKTGDHVITVNSFLWRAALDTVSFMPLTSVDPFGGVILTDWYSADSSSNERFKLNVLVLGQALRADGIKVSVFRQTSKGGKWRDAGDDTTLSRQIEDAILTRARQIRVDQLATQ